MSDSTAPDAEPSVPPEVAALRAILRAEALAVYWATLTHDDVKNCDANDASYISGVLRGYHDAALDLYNVLPLPPTEEDS